MVRCEWAQCLNEGCSGLTGVAGDEKVSQSICKSEDQKSNMTTGRTFAALILHIAYGYKVRIFSFDVEPRLDQLVDRREGRRPDDCTRGSGKALLRLNRQASQTARRS